jgi:hypothetical protein
MAIAGYQELEDIIYKCMTMSKTNSVFAASYDLFNYFSTLKSF